VSTPTSIHAATRLAAELRYQADLIRGRASHLRLAGANLRWRSPAANAFHNRLDRTLSTLLQCAAQFDDAAHTVMILAASS
jgi:hypothetical protein